MHDPPQYFALGNKWQGIAGELTHITVGRAGVWGLTPDGQASMLPTPGKIIPSVYQVPARILGQFLLEKYRSLAVPYLHKPIAVACLPSLFIRGRLAENKMY
jgi:hypothetical protein